MSTSKPIIILLLLISTFTAAAQSGWHAVQAAPGDVRIDDVSFINDSTGWLVARDSVFKTTDKGETWSFISEFEGYTRSIEFINEQVGFIGTLMSANDSAGLFKTIDGGLSFTRIDSLLPVSPADGICGIAHLNNLVIAVGSVLDATYAFKSTDAGVTWTLADLDTLSSGLIDVFIVDSLTYLISGVSDSTSVTGQPF